MEDHSCWGGYLCTEHGMSHDNLRRDNNIVKVFHANEYGGLHLVGKTSH